MDVTSPPESESTLFVPVPVTHDEYATIAAYANLQGVTVREASHRLLAIGVDLEQVRTREQLRERRLMIGERMLPSFGEDGNA